jgi:hypothetical protein
VKKSEFRALIREEIKRALNEKMNITKLKKGDRIYNTSGNNADVEYIILDIVNTTKEALKFLKTKVIGIDTQQLKVLRQDLELYDTLYNKSSSMKWYVLQLRNILRPAKKMYAVKPEFELKTNSWFNSDATVGDRNKKGEYVVYTPSNKILFTVNDYKKNTSTWWDNPKAEIKTNTVTVITPNQSRRVIDYLKYKKLINGVNFKNIATDELIDNLSTILKQIKTMHFGTIWTNDDF